jgi:ParB-like chromosome segregation protein Spo0J
MTGARNQDGSAQEPARLLDIAQLDLSLVRRVRDGVCAEAVEDYAANLKVLPPVRVAEVDGRLVLIGGLHRLRAAERSGRTEVAALVEQMDWDKAVIAAAGDNRRHGVRMTAADKRAATRLLLEECPTLSDRTVAELVGCSHPTVAAVRQQLASASDRPPTPVAPEPQQNGSQVVNLSTSAGGPPLARAAPRRGRDGKAYRVAAGSRRAAKAARKRKGSASPGPTGSDDAPEVPPGMPVDYRDRAPLVAGYLRDILRPVEGGYRREALDLVVAGLTREDLRALEEHLAAALASAAAAPAA